MKACTAIAISAIVAMTSIDSVVGLAKYLDEIPNGSGFAKSLGHTADGYTDFGTAFSKAGATWTADFCKATYPGASMTNGEAFGDPCCTWKKGGKADKTVTAWTDKPTVKTECASAAAATTAPSSGSSSSPSPSTAAPSSSGSSSPSPATTTAAPSSGSSSSSPSVAPAGNSTKPSSSDSKGKGTKCKVKEEKSNSDDSDEDDDDN